MKYLKGILISVLSVIFVVSLFVISGHTQKEPETIKIGAILPLTGNLAAVGENAKNGILIAIEEVNEKYKIKGKIIELFIEDGRANPKDAVAAFNKLIEIDKVKFVIGEISSGATLSIAPVAERNKIILISPGASSPKLSNSGEYIFRTWHSTSYEGKYFAKYLYEIQRVKKIGILLINNEYGIGLLDEFSKMFESEGGRVVFKESFEQNQTDFKPVLTKIKNFTEQIDGIYLISYYKEAGLLMKQASELKINTKFFCSDGIQDPKLIEIGGKAIEGVIYPHAKTPDTTNQAVKNFQSKYKEKFGKEYGPTSDTAYDAFNVLIAAIDDVGYDTSRAKDYLFNIKNIEGASGKISFDENGDVLKEMEVKTVRDGKFIIYTNK